MKVYVVVRWFRDGDDDWVRQYETLKKVYAEALRYASKQRNEVENNFAELPDFAKGVGKTFDIINEEPSDNDRGVKWQIIEEEV